MICASAKEKNVYWWVPYAICSFGPVQLSYSDIVRPRVFWLAATAKVGLPNHTYDISNYPPTPADAGGSAPHRRYYTQTLLHKEVFTQRALAHRRVYTQKLFHREVFTQRSFYTQARLHTEVFYTEKSLHRGAFTRSGRLNLEAIL